MEEKKISGFGRVINEIIEHIKVENRIKGKKVKVIRDCK